MTAIQNITTGLSNTNTKAAIQSMDTSKLPSIRGGGI